MSNKYEQLIDFIINEDEAQARELFHQIVVEKSREIYESLIDEQDLEEIGGNEVEELVDEVSADESGMEEGEEMDMDMDDDAEEGEEMDMDDEDHHADVGGNEEMEDRVMDLEDALDQLKAEFDALMTDEAGEEEHNDGMNDPEMGMGDAEEEMGESPEAELARLREYVEKVAGVSNTEGGDGKAGPVAGENDMGGTADNIVQGGAATGSSTPKSQSMNMTTKPDMKKA